MNKESHRKNTSTLYEHQSIHIQYTGNGRKWELLIKNL